MKAWSKVSIKCIFDCFARLDKCAPEETEEAKERKRPEETEEQFRDWVEIYNYLPVAEVMSDEDIVQFLSHNAQNTENKTNDNYEKEEPMRELIKKRIIWVFLITI